MGDIDFYGKKWITAMMFKKNADCLPKFGENCQK
jgi:hypothetical protein